MSTASKDPASWCLGCGAPQDGSGPTTQQCSPCPPRQCLHCGEVDSMAAPCPCWTHLENMGLADLKGIFAAEGFDLSKDTK